MDKPIEKYELRLVEPECAPGSARYGALVTPENDISPLFPYLNAVMKNAWYDHENRVLILREPEQAYALRPREIRIGRANDYSHAQQLASEIVEKINAVWQAKDSITPLYTERKIPGVMAIFKLLPKTNCKECGYPTCLAFSADLRAGKVSPEQCPPLSVENRGKVLQLFAEE
ncbi:MAG: (Fe-S)-binding protein [Dehalococcoidales bacterium]|nr:(Fe-S)-binding protein [Dehalococcoidales bacterium]